MPAAAVPRECITHGGSVPTRKLISTEEITLAARAAASLPLAWSRTYPARADQVREARRFTAGVLDGCPAADDAILCVSELATNAVLHSNSAQPGGSFTVRTAVRDGGRLRIEVTDQGGPWAPRPDHDAGHGRGLLIVGRLAADWGITGDGVTSRTARFELDCPEPPGSTARLDQHGGSA